MARIFVRAAGACLQVMSVFIGGEKVRSSFITAALAASVIGIASISQAATLTATISNGANDGNVFDFPDSGGNYGTTGAGQPDSISTGFGDIRAGESSDGANNATGVFKFTLPTLATGQAVGTADLRLNIFAFYNVNTPSRPFYVDHFNVVGYSVNAAPVVFGDINNATNQQTVGSISVTGGTGQIDFTSAALVQAIQAAYDGGYTGIGIRVVAPTTPDGPFDQFVDLGASEIGDGDSRQPLITFTTVDAAVPEPASLGVLSLIGGVTLARRRRS